MSWSLHWSKIWRVPKSISIQELTFEFCACLFYINAWTFDVANAILYTFLVCVSICCVYRSHIQCKPLVRYHFSVTIVNWKKKKWKFKYILKVSKVEGPKPEFYVKHTLEILMLWKFYFAKVWENLSHPCLFENNM